MRSICVTALPSAMVPLALLLAAAPPPGHDWIIAANARVGPISASTTETDLRRVFSKASVVNQPVDVGEGETEPGTVIYKSDPSRALAILWRTDGSQKHPATIFICYGLVQGPCRWRTASGIGFGTTLRELEKRNGRPFTLTGFGWDNSGFVLSWQGGKLERELRAPGGGIGVNLFPRVSEADWMERVTPEEREQVSGDKEIASSHPVMQRLDPAIGQMVFHFPAPKAK